MDKNCQYRATFGACSPEGKSEPKDVLIFLTNNKSPTAWRWTVGQCVYVGGYEEVVSDLPATTGLRWLIYY